MTSSRPALKTKPGVELTFSPDVMTMLQAILRVLEDETLVGLPAEVVITAGTDGQHMVGSKHYTGKALDVRAKNFPSLAAKNGFLVRLERALGERYSVLHEGIATAQEHFHLQVRRGLS